MTVFKLDDSKVADGRILLFDIRYRDLENGDFSTPKTFRYVALKAGGRWFFTGTGRVPQDAGWGAVQKWLSQPGREVVAVHTVTESKPLWSNPPGGNRA